jgi:phosphoribosylaminoimidazole carboxylase PurE protein
MPDQPRVAVVMGSDSDLPVVEHTVETLETLGVPFEVRVLSAHRSPDAVEEYARTARERGLEAIIAAAGGAAHLAGVLAANTTLPIIGVPVPTSRMGGMDSLFSTLQMPSGVPVACVGLGKSGARNAAVLVAQILAGADPALRDRLAEYKAELSEGVGEQNSRVQEWLKERRG